MEQNENRCGEYLAGERVGLGALSIGDARRLHLACECSARERELDCISISLGGFRFFFFGLVMSGRLIRCY